MKGIIFTELLDLMTQELGLVETESLLSSCDLESQCAYTSVGNYPVEELLILTAKYADKTGEPVTSVMFKFAEFLFGKFETTFPQVFGQTSLLDFLEKVESFVHPEVRKLYPDAELPSFNTIRNNDSLVMRYKSKRCLSVFAQGLILAAIKRFDAEATLEIQDSDASGSETVFVVTSSNSCKTN